MNEEPVIGSSKQISSGELAVNQFVTVLNPTTRIVTQPVNHPSGVVVFENVKVEDTSFMGDALQVIAVCLPYVVFLRVGSSYPYKMDTRTTTFMELSKEYVEALTSTHQISR